MGPRGGGGAKGIYNIYPNRNIYIENHCIIGCSMVKVNVLVSVCVLAECVSAVHVTHMRCACGNDDAYTP